MAFGGKDRPTIAAEAMTAEIGGTRRANVATARLGMRKGIAGGALSITVDETKEVGTMAL
jgi:hypothetical protein